MYFINVGDYKVDDVIAYFSRKRVQVVDDIVTFCGQLFEHFKLRLDLISTRQSHLHPPIWA